MVIVIFWLECGRGICEAIEIDDDDDDSIDYYYYA